MSAPGRVVCVSFASADYYSTLHELIESVKPYIDGYIAFYDTDLPREFIGRNHQHFEDRRGFGYWVWKPFVILEALERVEDGDVVIYVDAGNLVIADLQPLVELCAATIDGVLLFDNRDSNPTGDAWKNSMWTTADCFALLDAETSEYTNGQQVDASYLMFQKRPESVAFAREFLEACERYELMRGPPSYTGPELPDFVEHRWDQSILSILAIRHGITCAREPSQDGNQAIGAASTYGQVFDHHRGRFRIPPDSLEARRLRARARRRALARRLLRRPKEIQWIAPEDREAAAPRRRPFPFVPLVTPRVPNQIIRQNRATLDTVSQWLPADARSASVFEYGVPEHAWSLLDRPTNDEPTCADLLCALGRHLPSALCYLEIGVSVGKNIMQVCRSFDDAELVGIEIEPLSPALTEIVRSAGSPKSWPPASESLKFTDSTMTEYRVDGTTNRLSYVNSDELDTRTWRALSGRRFNLVLSDALHEPEAIRFEIEQLTSLELLNREAGAVVWDDLHQPQLHAEFVTLRTPLAEYLGRSPGLFATTRLNGWLGQHEPAHVFGVAAWGETNWWRQVFPIVPPNPGDS